MSRVAINERTTSRLTVSFWDPDGEPAVPTSVTYRIDDVDSGTEVRGDTSITPAAELEITLTPDDTRIIGARSKERRKVTVRATYGADDEVNDDYEYSVINLEQVS